MDSRNLPQDHARHRVHRHIRRSIPRANWAMDYRHLGWRDGRSQLRFAMGMCFWVILLAITVNQAALLAAAQQIGWQAVFATLTAILNLVLSIWLVRRFGTIGVLSGTVISYLLLVVIPQTWVVRRTLRGRYLKLTVQREPVEEVSIYGI